MTDAPAARTIHARYRDPLDEIWLAAAARIGLRIERTSDVYASYDGRGTLRLSTPEHFDPDDSLAQLILHELCHAVVAGPGAFEREDWGLSNLDATGLVAEHACHRLQAALTGAHGVRHLFAVTTDHRDYWDGLGDDPLEACDDPAVELARQAHTRALQPPFGPVLRDALERTARLAQAVGPIADADSLWSPPRGH